MSAAVKLALGLAAWAALGLTWVGTAHAQFPDEPVCYNWSGGDKSAGSFTKCTTWIQVKKVEAPKPAIAAPSPIMMPMQSCPPVEVAPKPKVMKKRPPPVKC